MKSSKQIGADVLKQEIKGLQALSQRIDKNFDAATEWLDIDGKVIISGVGKSGHIGRKIASTMVSLGTPAVFVHPTEAAHGDLGLFDTNQDALLMLSRSGSAVELLPVAGFAKEHNIPSVLISENVESGLCLMANITLKLPRVDEAWGHAPTTSTIMQLAVGDALSIALANKRRFSESDFRKTHPGGVLSSVAN